MEEFDLEKIKQSISNNIVKEEEQNYDEYDYEDEDVDKDEGEDKDGSEGEYDEYEDFIDYEDTPNSKEFRNVKIPQEEKRRGEVELDEKKEEEVEMVRVDFRSLMPGKDEDIVGHILLVSCGSAIALILQYLLVLMVTKSFLLPANVVHSEREILTLSRYARLTSFWSVLVTVLIITLVLSFKNRKK